MSGRSEHELTALHQAWRGGDRAVLDRLVSLIYAGLYRLAHHYIARERRGQTLQISALLNEAYLRLIDVSQVDWRDRAHSFAVAPTVMRQVLIQYARAWHARKRGGSAVRVEFSATRPSRNGSLLAPQRSRELGALGGPSACGIGLFCAGSALQFGCRRLGPCFFQR